MTLRTRTSIGAGALVLALATAGAAQAQQDSTSSIDRDSVRNAAIDSAACTVRTYYQEGSNSSWGYTASGLRSSATDELRRIYTFDSSGVIEQRAGNIRYIFDVAAAQSFAASGDNFIAITMTETHKGRLLACGCAMAQSRIDHPEASEGNIREAQQFSAQYCTIR